MSALKFEILPCRDTLVDPPSGIRFNLDNTAAEQLIVRRFTLILIAVGVLVALVGGPALVSLRPNHPAGSVLGVVAFLVPVDAAVRGTK